MSKNMYKKQLLGSHCKVVALALAPSEQMEGSLDLALQRRQAG